MATEKLTTWQPKSYPPVLCTLTLIEQRFCRRPIEPVDPVGKLKSYPQVHRLISLISHLRLLL